jgi:hypothetical protein
VDNRYAFQLGQDVRDVGGQRLWDINICCVLPEAYTLQFKANASTPQRGFVITDLQGDVFDIESGSAVLVLFDIGYQQQRRSQPVRVMQLLNGTLWEVACTAPAELVVSTAMTIDVTISGQLIHVSLVNDALSRESALTCTRLDSGPSGRRLVGMGAMRSAGYAYQLSTPLYFENFEITEISGVRSETRVTGQPINPVVPCTGQSFTRFDMWINAALTSGCTED